VIVNIPDADAAVVRAILLTHAEMQDQQAIANEELRGRLADEPEMVEDLKDIHEVLSDDTDNLKRLANFFA